MGGMMILLACLGMTLRDANLEWLKHRIEQYQASKTDACEAIDDFDELDKLKQGFT
jgi:hypothetical protein